MERNGIAVKQLVGTIEAVKERPELAQFKFRSETTWLVGGRWETRIQSVSGTGQRDESQSAPFVLTADELAVLYAAPRGIILQEVTLHLSILRGTFTQQAFSGHRPIRSRQTLHIHWCRRAGCNRLVFLLSESTEEAKLYTPAGEFVC